MPAVRPKRLRRRVIYDGRIFRVELDQVRLATGREAAMEIVRHRGSVVLLPQPTPDQVVLVRQYRYVIDEWIWELPAGSLERGERLDACARRECEEEIGLRPSRIRRLATLYPTPGFCDEVMVFFACTSLRPPRGEAARDADEQLEPRTFAIAEVRRMIRRGAIVDMKTVVGVGLLVGS